MGYFFPFNNRFIITTTTVSSQLKTSSDVVYNQMTFTHKHIYGEIVVVEYLKTNQFCLGKIKWIVL